MLRTSPDPARLQRTSTERALLGPETRTTASGNGHRRHGQRPVTRWEDPIQTRCNISREAFTPRRFLAQDKAPKDAMKSSVVRTELYTDHENLMSGTARAMDDRRHTVATIVTCTVTKSISYSDQRSREHPHTQFRRWRWNKEKQLDRPPHGTRHSAGATIHFALRPKSDPKAHQPQGAQSRRSRTVGCKSDLAPRRTSCRQQAAVCMRHGPTWLRSAPSGAAASTMRHAASAKMPQRATAEALTTLHSAGNSTGCPKSCK